MKLNSVCLFFILICAATFGYTQEPGKTRILYTGNMQQFNKEIYADGPRLIGNVVINHDSIFLYCDSAWVNEVENRVIAYGNVNLKLSDTLNLFCDSLRYNGNTKIAHANSNVRLVDNETILTSDTLTYDRNTQTGRYDYWGKIVNDRNILVSHHGYYFTDKKEFFFKEKVMLINPQYRMYSDTLMYNMVTEVAYFYGPSHIISKDKKDSIYCEKGWYNTTLDVARFRDRAKIYHESTFLTGDSLYYERNNEFGQVFKHAFIIDTTEKIILTGNYGEMQQKKGFAYMVDSAQTIIIEKKDSLFMHADTLWATFDTANNIRDVYGYHKVKFFRRNLQGMCDSLHIMAQDSTLTMYREPVLWSDSNQLSSDSITLQMRNGEADTLKMNGNAFIISKDDSASFNQIKGRKLVAKFRENQLYKINVFGNAQTIYYAREEDKTLIGINSAMSSNLLIFLEKNQLKSITFIGSPDAHTYPEKDLPREERLLKNFKWLEKSRPKNKADIFRW